MKRPAMPRDSDATPESVDLPARHRRRDKWRLLASLCMIALLIGVAIWASPHLQLIREALGPLAPVVTIPIQALVSISPVPGDILCIANGAMYGFLLGVVYSWLGWLLAALVEFRIARTGSRVSGVSDYMRTGPKWLRRLPFDHPLYLILARQIPGLGGHLVIVSAATTEISTARFMAYSAIAIVPGAIVMPGIGAGVSFFV